eukprot:10173099-Lingulodinium_polyedra.AAC.1
MATQLQPAVITFKSIAQHVSVEAEGFMHITAWMLRQMHLHSSSSWPAVEHLNTASSGTTAWMLWRCLCTDSTSPCQAIQPLKSTVAALATAQGTLLAQHHACTTHNIIAQHNSIMHAPRAPKALCRGMLPHYQPAAAMPICSTYAMPRSDRGPGRLHEMACPGSRGRPSPGP